MHRKHWFLTGICAIALPLAVVATAFACGSLATLKLNRATAKAGNTVRAVGGNFNSNAKASAVQLRFNGRNGRVLWEGRPATNGRFTADFEMPSATPGQYVILATQTGPDGRPAAGTPGRAPLKMRKSKSSRKSESAESSSVAVWSSPGDGGPAAPLRAPAPVAVILGSALLAVALAGGGVALVARRSRRRGLRLARSVS